MKSVIQRVSRAAVAVAGEVVGEIGAGLVVLVCAEPADTPALMDRTLDRLLKLRIFSDDEGRMNRALTDVPGSGLLLISQFTLGASLAGGNRPSFTGAAPAEQARPLFDHLLAQARIRHPRVAAGRFGAEMQVTLVNDGPVTILLDLK
jgi:D-aminoacyl-tRNA deacylase